MKMSATEANVLPWDTSVGNRFAHYSPKDHSATLWIATALALIYVLGMLIVRIYIKWRVFGWDDNVIVVGTMFTLSQSIVMLGALSRGLGKVSEDVESLQLVGRLAVSTRVLFMVSHYLAKLSVVFLLRRLFARDQMNPALLCDLTIALTVLSGIASVLISVVRCPVSLFFIEHCHDQIIRWNLITALDVTTEVLTLILPSYLVWQIQMRTQIKLRVIAAFIFRIFVIVLSAVHLSLWTSYSDGQPSSIAIVPTFILQQTLLAVSIITATVPNLKAFLQSLSASKGEAGLGNGNTTFEMKDMALNPLSASGKTIGSSNAKKHYPSFKTRVIALNRNVGKRNSLVSGESQDLIIHKQTAWAVERA